MRKHNGQLSQFATQPLKLVSPSDAQLHQLLVSFEHKWQTKARHALHEDAHVSKR